MQSSRLLKVFLVTVVAGCAAATQAGAPASADERLHLGLEALADQDMVTAREHLDWVYRNHPSESVGTYALLALTAAELDPRNPTRSLETAAALSGELLHSPEAPEWSRPVGQTFQLVAMELAGEKMRRQAPTTAADGADARLEEVVAQRDSLKGQVTTLEQQVAATRKELDEKKAELERIKKTIKG